MTPFQSLVTQNPMLVEISRFRRRMFSGRDGGSNRAVVTTLGILYCFILFTVIRFASDLPPVWIILFQTGLFTLMLPVMAAGAIAGERERRTWDILLTTPVSKAQIVVGKFIAIAAGYAVFLVAAGLLIVACQIANRAADFMATFHAEVLSITFALLLMALSLLISARSRTTFAAIGATVGVVFVVYLAAPLFIATAFNNDAGSNFLDATYPFATIANLADATSDAAGARFVAPLGQDIVYTFLAATLLAGAVSTVRKAEEVKDYMAEPKGQGEGKVA